MEGRKILKATVPFAKENRKRSWLHTLETLAALAVLYVLILLDLHWSVSLIVSLVLSLTLVRLFIIYHDYLHNAILQKSKLARAFFTVYGMYVLAPSSIWKRSHDYHHQHNSKLYTTSIGSFPIVTKEKFLEFSSKERLRYLFIRHPLTILNGYIFAFIYGMCIRAFFKAADKHWDCLVALVMHFGIGALFLTFFGWNGFLFAFLIPAFLSSAMGSYLFYAQHNFPGATFRDKEGWTYIHAALESSSYMKMNVVMRWFTGNIGYHHIHHMNAAIPFYRLPEAFKAIPELQHPKATSLKPMDIVRCLRLKVWDFDKQRMIPLREISPA